MKKAIVFGFGIFLMMLICITGCTNSPDAEVIQEVEAVENSAQNDEPAFDDPEDVTTMPDGFVCVNTLLEEYGDILWFESFEDAFCAVDLDYVCIWQGLFSVSSSIVSYEGEYYLSQSVAEEIVAAALQTAEAKQKIYSIGEAVPLGEIRGKEVLITIESVTIEDDTYIIRYSLQNHPGGQYAPELFDRAETDDGHSYSDFFAASTGSISVKIPAGQALCKIILRGEGADTVRVVALCD